jgi:hypothetical protein
MQNNPNPSPQESKNNRPNTKSRRLFCPGFWNAGAVLCSMAYFVILVYLMDIGLTAEPKLKTGYAIYRFVTFAFLPFALIGAIFCITALVFDARQKKWGWFIVVLFFSFFFFSHLWMMVSENFRAMQHRRCVTDASRSTPRAIPNGKLNSHAAIQSVISLKKWWELLYDNCW